MKINVVGGGPGNPYTYTMEGLNAIRDGEIVITSIRLHDSIIKVNDNIRTMGIVDTIIYLKENPDELKNATVVASGDVGFYSIAATIRRNLNDSHEINYYPGLSSFQLLAARLGTSYEDWKLISLHGHDKWLIPYVTYNERVFALTGGKIGIKEALNELITYDLGHLNVHIGERLSMEGEKVTSGTASRLIENNFDPLAVLMIENPKASRPGRKPEDREYNRGKAPMTKEAVRNLSVDVMDILKDDVVWDIGSGTGAVSCAMAYQAYEGTVWAVEMKEDAIALTGKNRKALGAYNIRVVEGRAPDALKGLPAPDKVFIGGTTGSLKVVLETVYSANPNAVVVANAIALETIGKTVDTFKEFGCEVEVTCINVANSKALGKYHLMMADNPIYIIKGVRHEDR